MHMWRWWRGRDGARDAEPEDGLSVPSAGELRDERLSLYLDGELPADGAAAVERELAADAQTRAALEGIRSVRDSLQALGAGELGELRAPRPFTLTAPAVARGGMGRSELAARVGAIAAAVALVAVVSGDALVGGDTASRDAADEATSTTANVANAPATGAPEAAELRSAAGDDGDDSAETARRLMHR
jgi:anti-sigma factor RsiW